MPRPVKELAAKQRPLSERILDFLRGDPSNAYALHEIISAVEAGPDEQTRRLMSLMLLMAKQSDRTEVYNKYTAALDLLEKNGQAQSYRDAGIVYFGVGGSK